MPDLRDELVRRLTALPGVSVALYKDTDLLCVFHNHKEIAHFQNEQEIDIRLTPKIIQQNGLHPPPDTTSHLDRPTPFPVDCAIFCPAGNAWIDIVSLVRLAAEL
jgi:hypothetical protein